MQLDNSRQFTWPTELIVQWACRSDCIVAANVEVSFYSGKEQPTGRILVSTVGTDKAAVSIPYWAAKELFENKRDLPVVFGSSRALNNTMAKLIYDESLIPKIRSRAYAWSRNTAPYLQVSCREHRAWVHEFHLNTNITNWLAEGCKGMQLLEL